MILRFTVSILFVLAFNGLVSSQSNDEFIYNLDSKDGNDWSFVSDFIKDKRVIYLGELSHFDGTTYDIKVNFIKYLHQELGFNHLFLERGFTDVDRAYRDIVEKRDSAIGVFCWLVDLFGRRLSANEKILASYIGQTIDEGSPLKLHGFDVIESSVYSDSFYPELEQFLNNHSEIQFDESVRSLFTILSKKGKVPKASTYKELRPFLKSLDLSEMQEAAEGITKVLELAKANAASDWEVSRLNYFQQGVRSRVQHDRCRVEYFLGSKLKDNDDPRWTAQRDSVMADNIKWFLKNNPQEKIIISGATFHGSRDFRRGGVSRKVHKNVVPMAQYIVDEIADEFCNVAFITHSGYRGANDKPSHRTYSKIAPPSKGSVEYCLGQKIDNYAFINLSQLNLPRYLGSSCLMNPAFTKQVKGEWHKIYDALIFIKTMKPYCLISYKERSGLAQPYKLPEDYYAN